MQIRAGLFFGIWAFVQRQSSFHFYHVNDNKHLDMFDEHYFIVSENCLLISDQGEKNKVLFQFF